MDLSNHALTSPPDLLAGICVLHSRVPVVLAVALPEEVAGPLAVLLVKLFIAGVALGLLGIWLKERDVAARIAGMSTGIRAARTGSGVPARLPATGTDPISQFAGEINQVFDELERSRQRLMESRDRYHHLFESGNDFLLVCAVGREGTPYRILDA